MAKINTSSTKAGPEMRYQVVKNELLNFKRISLNCFQLNRYHFPSPYLMWIMWVKINTLNKHFSVYPGDLGDCFTQIGPSLFI